MSNQTVSFNVQGSNVLSYMDSVRERSTNMANQFIRDSQRQGQTGKDQLKAVEERIKALERERLLTRRIAEESIRQEARNRIQSVNSSLDARAALNAENRTNGNITPQQYREEEARIAQSRNFLDPETILRDAEDRVSEHREGERDDNLVLQQLRLILEGIRTGSQGQIGAIISGNETLENLQTENIDELTDLSNRIVTEGVGGENPSDEEKRPSPALANMMSVANGILVDRLGSMVSSMPGAKNELEYIKPMMSIMGASIAGVLGSLGDMVLGASGAGFGLGNSSLGVLGIQAGGKLGEFAGSALERTYKTREDLTISNLALKAMTGGLGSVDNNNGPLGGKGYISGLGQDYSHLGKSFNEISQLQYNIASRKGSSSGLGNSTRDVLGLEKGYGVKEETSLSLLELLRHNKKGDKDLGNIVSGVLEKGITTMFKNDRTYLNEFLTKNYTQLQKTLLNTQSSVASGTVYDILSKFNAVGGQFDVKDSRSGGLINSVQSSLANPSSDTMKALSFHLMKKEYPDMNLADIGIETQKGLGSEKYFGSVMKYLSELGGDDSYQTYNVASAFGLQGNLSAARELLTGYRNGTFNGGMDQSNLLGSGSPMGLAEQQTSYYQKSTAEIENAFIEGAIDGINEVKGKMTNLFGVMIDELEEFVRSEIKKLISGGKKQLVDNTTNIPGRK